VVQEPGPRFLVDFEELGLVDPVGQPERRGLDHRHISARRVASTTADFPPGFFDRADEGDDAAFYAPPRLVTHIDDGAVAAVGELYEELGVTGDVLDLMSSWVSHFRSPPRRLLVLGMNKLELDGNPIADERIVHDLNADPRIPLPNECVDDAVCCVSVDYLTRPVDVFRDVARVLRPGGRFVVTFSNRLFPTKAIRGWLYSSDDEHCRIVAEYFAQSRVFGPPTVSRRTPPDHRGDPLFAVWAPRADI
jgi:SAM-dependent methyltransferase